MQQSLSSCDARTCAAPAPELLAAIIDHVKLGVFTFDSALVVTFGNATLCTMLGVPAATCARHCTLAELLDHATVLDKASVQGVHELCIQAVSGRQALESVFLAAGQGARTLAVHVAQLDEAMWMATLEDATQRHAEEARAIEQAMRDMLTGLPNRQVFQQRATRVLEDAAAREARTPGCPHACLMMLDLDRFKPVNDTLGHAIGDAVLRLVARRLRSVLRAEDVVARLGGDEFAILLERLSEREMAELAGRLADVVGRPYLVDGHVINIGASIGMARAPMDGTQYDQLLRNADLALYHVKRAGRGACSFFDPQMDARATARRNLEIDLRKALALAEFVLHYQPQVDLERGAIVGFEALLRWHHPERGVVSPVEFIPLAEEIGLIKPLGEWVLREACREAARWPGELSVAVNVAPHQFSDSDRLVGMIARALAESGLTGERLEIEVTESVLLSDEAAVLGALHQIRAMGVRVAMDDFGTGYSSLSQLRSFPFDKIKIDKSFLRAGEDLAGQNAVIRAITALGASLGMSTIAEGVETVEQLQRIRNEGCGSVQGYLFSRPVPADQIADVIAGFVVRLAQPLAAAV